MNENNKLARIVLVISIIGIIIAFLPVKVISLYWKIGLVSSAVLLDFILVSSIKKGGLKNE